MARLAGKMRGDLRAMEEQESNPRTNPVRGAGATPSMGLSQYRGGNHCDTSSESDEELQGGSLERMVGAGTHKGQRRKTARRAYEGSAHHSHTSHKHQSMNEATAMGLHLGRHLHSLHGAGWWDDFKSGFNSVISPVAGVAKGLLPLLGPEGTAASGVIGALGYGKARRGARGLPRKGGSILSSATRYLGRQMENPNSLIGKVTNSTLNNLPTIAKFLTTDFKPRGGRRGGASVSKTGQYEGEGRERDDVAMMMGNGELQGSGFLSDLLGNIPLIGGPASALTGAIGLGRRRRGGAMLGENGHGQLQGNGPFMKALHQIRNEVLNDVSGKGSEELQGSGFLSDLLGNIPLIGGPASALTGAIGLGRKKRAPAGPNDGRRRRAEIVKKVMAERGCSMIEASKYVKAHGLY